MRICFEEGAGNKTGRVINKSVYNTHGSFKQFFVKQIV